MTLPENIGAEIDRLSQEGDDLAKQSRYDEALGRYASALAMLPEPKETWEAATWLLTAAGDAHFLKANFVAGRESLARAVKCPDALGTPFLHLRFGQCEFELGHLDQAADELMRAYMAAGREIFDDEDPKYLEFLGTRAKEVLPPKKSWQFWRK